MTMKYISTKVSEKLIQEARLANLTPNEYFTSLSNINKSTETQTLNALREMNTRLHRIETKLPNDDLVVIASELANQVRKQK